MVDDDFVNFDNYDEENGTMYSMKKGIVTIKSLLHGIFYASIKPDEKPFVKIGDMVSEDDIVCVVDCMKMMNEIPADVNGTIVEVLVKNGDEVAQGQPLFKVNITRLLDEPWTC